LLVLVPLSLAYVIAIIDGQTSWATNHRFVVYVSLRAIGLDVRLDTQPEGFAAGHFRQSSHRYREQESLDRLARLTGETARTLID
jgi:hypothetical protein